VQKATRKQTRVHNSRLIFKTIYDREEVSRADIARETGLTRTTVSDVVGELIGKGLVEEIGYGPSAGGKPPILLSVVDDSYHLMGIDLASGEFRGAIVNLRGEIRHRIDLPLDDRDGEIALSLVYKLIDRLMQATDSPLLGIGIGSPGLMDPIHGVVRRSVNLDWRDLPLRSLLRERYGLPVYVANDSQTAALAEYTFSDIDRNDNLVVVKIENGIGAGIVLNSRLLYGDTFGAGEIGHMVVVDGGQRCRCGNFGCLETVASARSILRQAQPITRNPQSLLAQYVADGEEITLPLLRKAFLNGDEMVTDLLSNTARYLGVALASCVSVLSIRRILIAGEIAIFGEEWLHIIRQVMIQRSLSLVANETEVGASSISPDIIVILGASALVLTYELGLFAPLLIGAPSGRGIFRD